MKLKNHLKITLLLFILSFLVKISVAQSSKVEVGKVKGVLKDSVTNIIVNNATVAIYNLINESRIIGSKVDKSGDFEIPNLPLVIPLELRITHLGYKTYKKTFILQKNETLHDFGIISLNPEIQQKNNLQTVKVLSTRSGGLILLGGVKGKVKDSTYKFVLSSATVSVYNVADSNLLKFAIPNNFGEFNIQNLPVNTPLKLQITHLGYTPFSRLFRINTNGSTIDLDWIYMHQNSDKENNLKEVEITSYAPVRMKGDTLEFNPRAFKMDANATTEDLMRILPGIVIWGDGDITFNGKKINSLLVDGKPFMGGGVITTATQNLPKDALDRIQIYGQRNEKNPLDSTLHANLKLKEDKKIGYFGKIGAGYGSTNRFATDGMLSGYNKKLQVITVGAFNNINKSADNIIPLINSNSYEGEGNNIDYQSDFRKAGISRSTTAGAKFQYDFIPAVNNQRNRRLTADYFFKQNNETINSTRLINTLIKTDSILSNRSTNEITNISNSSILSATYNDKDRNYNFTISANASINNNDNIDKSEGEQTRTGIVGQLSKSNSLITNDNVQKKIALNAQFDYQKEKHYDDVTKKRKTQLFGNFSIGYTFDHEENISDRYNLSSILSITSPNENKTFDRLYEDNRINSGHTLRINYPNFKKLLFGSTNLGGINLDLGGRLTFLQTNIKTTVFDAGGLQYETNNYLTNKRIENVRDMQPQLSISKNFYKDLSNRYNKSFDIFVIPKLQFYSMQSSALQEVQNFKYKYFKFIPNASINYHNHQYGDFEVNSSLNYSANINYPILDQIAPLVDSANVYYIPKGNLLLKPEHSNTFTLKISLESRKPKNPYQIDISLDGNFTRDKISDSTFYDNLGRNINYTINLQGYRYRHLGASYRKSYSPNKRNTYRLNIWYNRYDFSIPQYIDAIFTTSNNLSNSFEFEMAYSFLDMVNVNAKQGFSFYRNLQSTNDQPYKGLNDYSRLSGALLISQNLVLSSNINFVINKAENQPAVQYTLWNANLSYRFMKDKGAEVKFSALDLLKQNKSVINSSNQNVQTFGFTNVLQQYFMLSFAYYPRQFGTRSIKK